MSWVASEPGTIRGQALRWLVLLVLATCFTFGASAQTPEGEGDLNVAGLVVDYGDGRMSYAVVPFTEESLSGIELLRRSGLTLLTVPFGGLGEGVCSIESTGCDLGACRTRMCQSADRESPFWQYVRQGEDGTWAPAALGATHARVEDGDVDAWAWTGTDPELPPISIASLRDRLQVPDEWQTNGGALPEPIVLTEGGPPAVENGDVGWRQVILGLAVISGVGVLGTVMVRRSRRRSHTGGR
jgi:hypothetical protein